MQLSAEGVVSDEARVILSEGGSRLQKLLKDREDFQRLYEDFLALMKENPLEWRSICHLLSRLRQSKDYQNDPKENIQYIIATCIQKIRTTFPPDLEPSIEGTEVDDVRLTKITSAFAILTEAANMGTLVTWEDIADTTFNGSQYDPHKRFTAAYGVPPKQYYQQVRFQCAKDLLKHGISYSTASLVLGFKRPAVFKQFFEKFSRTEKD